MYGSYTRLEVKFKMLLKKGPFFQIYINLIEKDKRV